MGVETNFTRLAFLTSEIIVYMTNFPPENVTAFLDLEKFAQKAAFRVGSAEPPQLILAYNKMKDNTDWDVEEFTKKCLAEHGSNKSIENFASITCIKIPSNRSKNVKHQLIPQLEKLIVKKK